MVWIRVERRASVEIVLEVVMAERRVEVCDVFDVVAGRTKAVAEAAKLLMMMTTTTSRAVGQIIALNGQQQELSLHRHRMILWSSSSSRPLLT